jgi:GntR family transcriptional regulator/MocR family aminotransferase
MERSFAPEASVTVGLDRSSAVPLYRQLYEGLREGILAGTLPAGSRLPSVRALVRELKVSRNTVEGALAQLSAEGYLEARIGSGTYVSGALPDDALRAGRARGTARGRVLPGGSGPVGREGLSRRGATLAGTPVSASGRRRATEPRPFRPAVPAIEEFPLKVWRRLAGEFWRRPPRGSLGYGEPAGYRPLRMAIAEHLRAYRAVRCSWEQVIVVSGSQQALDLCARLLLDEGDRAWIEDPCYLGARAALSANGARLVPVPVDDDGLDVASGETQAPDARLACVTPSHQYPTGATMSLSRRLALLAWASRTGAWVLEDDYDGEFRYSGRPLSSLQGLDDEGRVIYVGTFSKVLSPALRIGYAVVPPGLVDAFQHARAVTDRHPPVPEEAILAEFVAEGHFARHLRRMRGLYAERQQALVAAADAGLAGLLEVRPSGAGLHLVGRLPDGADDVAISGSLAAGGVEAPSLSAHRFSMSGTPGLVLGYAAFDETAIRDGVERLAGALREAAS